MNAPGSDWSHAFVMNPLCISSWDCMEEETTTSLTHSIEEQLSSWKANSSTAQITYRAAGSWYWIQQPDCIFFTSQFQFRQEATSSVRTTAEEQGRGNLSDGVGFVKMDSPTWMPPFTSSTSHFSPFFRQETNSWRFADLKLRKTKGKEFPMVQESRRVLYIATEIGSCFTTI